MTFARTTLAPWELELVKDDPRHAGAWNRFCNALYGGAIDEPAKRESFASRFEDRDRIAPLSWFTRFEVEEGDHPGEAGPLRFEALLEAPSTYWSLARAVVIEPGWSVANVAPFGAYGSITHFELDAFSSESQALARLLHAGVSSMALGVFTESAPLLEVVAKHERFDAFALRALIEEPKTVERWLRMLAGKGITKLGLSMSDPHAHIAAWWIGTEAVRRCTRLELKGMAFDEPFFDVARDVSLPSSLTQVRVQDAHQKAAEGAQQWIASLAPNSLEVLDLDVPSGGLMPRFASSLRRVALRYAQWTEHDFQELLSVKCPQLESLCFDWAASRCEPQTYERLKQWIAEQPALSTWCVSGVKSTTGEQEYPSIWSGRR